MQKILVASSKGGCGKTTIATNLAAHFAQEGKNTVLVDADRQGSSQRWAEKRAGLPAAVLAISGLRKDWQNKSPEDAERVIIDGPAGIRAGELAELLDGVDALLISAPFPPLAVAGSRVKLSEYFGGRAPSSRIEVLSSFWEEPVVPSAPGVPPGSATP